MMKSLSDGEGCAEFYKSGEALDGRQVARSG